MTNVVKKAIQGTLVAARHREYEEQIKRQTVTPEEYLDGRRRNWQEELKRALKASAGTEQEKRGEKTLSLKTVSYREAFASLESLQELATKTREDLILFVEEPGRLLEGASEDIRQYFELHKEARLAYGDESNRLKPDWSPDTLLSFFYFGNYFAMTK